MWPNLAERHSTIKWEFCTFYDTIMKLSTQIVLFVTYVTISAKTQLVRTSMHFEKIEIIK